MKVLGTKIVNGKKLYLIDEQLIKAETGFSGNFYYVPIQGINSSDNLKTKFTTAKQLTKEQVEQLQNSPTSAKNIAIKEALEKTERLKKSEQAYKKRQETGIQSSQDLADETGAIGDKIALQNIPYVGKYIPNILDVTQGIGNMASGLGRIPLNLEKGNYGQAALSVAMPLGVGALAGVGAENTGQFVNNLANPLAGTGELINNLGNKYLPNVYKLNPWAFKPQEGMMYRGVGEPAITDAIESGIIRQNPSGRYSGTDLFVSPNYNVANMYSTSAKLADKNVKKALIEIPKDAANFIQHDKFGFHFRTSDVIPTSKAKLYKQDWLKGYKEVPKPKSTFKSEIDWSKWNKEIPENKALMQEYNVIEQQTKANGTWMKNPDGSPFQGSPEQFVQQNSQNFKKAFGNSKLVNPDGSPTIQYHGSAKKFDTFDENKFQLGDSGYSGQGIYTTPSKTTANSYATSSAKFHKGDIEPTVYELYGQANNPISSSQLIKENKGRDLFNFHRKKNWKGDLTPEESLMDYDAAIADQLPNVESIRPWNDAREIVFPTNKQLKSAIGNNGMFDMTNPNIYKTIVGGLATGTLGKEAMRKKEFGGDVKAELGTMLKIRRTTPVPISKAESEFYRTFSNAKGLGRGFVTYDHSPESGWLHTTPKGKTFYSSNDGYDKNNKPSPGNDQDSPIEWTDSYDSNEALPDNNDGYHMKYQESTGRNYYDVSRDFPSVTPDKWNTAKFAFAPFFLKGGDNGGWMYNTASGGNNPMILPDGDFKKKRMLMEDIYKYNLSNPDLSRKEAWRESRKFVNKEVMPLVHSDYYKYYKQGVDLGRVDTITNGGIYEKLPESDAYKMLVDFNKRFRKMDSKEAKAAAKVKPMEFGGKILDTKIIGKQKMYLIEE